MNRSLDKSFVRSTKVTVTPRQTRTAADKLLTRCVCMQANDPAYPVPRNWNGQMSMILMLQNGPASSAVRIYLQQNSNQPLSVAAATQVAITPATAAVSFAG